MGDSGQDRRKRASQERLRRLSGKPFALPVEIVMMGDRRDAAPFNEVGDCQPERQVHRDRDRILRDEEIDLEAVAKSVERGMKEALESGDLSGDAFGKGLAVPDRAVDLCNLRMFEVRLGHDVGMIGRMVAETAEPERPVPVPLEHFGPFARFERDPVRSRKACGDKADIHSFFSMA